MVARGDLGVEVPFYELPEIQKHLIKTAIANGKRVVTATQMLDSMSKNPRCNPRRGFRRCKRSIPTALPQSCCPVRPLSVSTRLRPFAPCP